MTLKVNIDMPGCKGQIEVKDVKELIEKASFLQSLPLRCPVDGSATRFMYRNPKGFEYHGLESTGEKRYRLTFGVYKDSGELFYRDQWTYFDGNQDVTVWQDGQLVGGIE